MLNAPQPTSDRHASPMRVMVFGARGRMGHALQKAIAESSSCTLVAAVGRGDQVPTSGVDLVIDFSSDEGAKSALAASERLSAPLLVGTTALSQHTLEALQRVASRVPVMVTSNASLGVAVLHRMADLATRVLGPNWRVEMTETHHTKKLDAPSGTALALAQTVRSAGGALPSNAIRSIRQGDVVGHHRIDFHGEGESVTLEHHAHDRSLFARGALQLGLWLRTQRPGMHTMQQWLEDRLRAAGSNT